MRKKKKLLFAIERRLCNSKYMRRLFCSLGKVAEELDRLAESKKRK